MKPERKAAIRKNAKGKWRGYLGDLHVIEFENEEEAKKWLEAPYKPEPKKIEPEPAAVVEKPQAQRVLISDVGPIDETQLRTNANHEAGHAVIMTRIAHGCEVTTVDPQEAKRLTGFAAPGYTKPTAKPLSRNIYLCTVLAGITSEAMFGTGFVNPTEDDITHANEILDRAGLQGAAREQAFLQARMRTQQLITQYKADIIAVADALVERLTLTGDQVRALLK